MLTGISLAGHIDNHSLGHTGGYVDLDDLFAFLNTGTTTVLTLILDYLTLTITGGADTLLLHHTEDALGGVGDDTLSMTSRTSLLAAACLST